MSVIDVDKTNFDAVVIEGSKEAPVLVDFWAPWCAPCRALGPVLEKLAEEYAGRFTLAKINSDENPELSARYGVRGIPNVKAFVGGEVVDEFSGALPESGVRRFLSGLVPSAVDELRDEADDMPSSGGSRRPRTPSRTHRSRCSASRRPRRPSSASC